MSTASNDGARSHARAQARHATMRVPTIPPHVDPSQLTWAESVPANGYTTKLLGRGSRLRPADPGGAACAHVLLYRAEAPWERLNVADTVKVPWQAYLAPGYPPLFDQGRVLATVVADPSGRHDALCGPGERGRALMLLGALKHGLDERDVAPSVSFFAGVRSNPTEGWCSPAAPAPRSSFSSTCRWWCSRSTPRIRWTRLPAPAVSTWWPGGPARNSRHRSTTTPNTCADCSTPRRGVARGIELRGNQMSLRQPPNRHRRDRARPLAVVKGRTRRRDLRIIDRYGNQAVDRLLCAAGDHRHRYSAQATVTAQRNIFPTTNATP